MKHIPQTLLDSGNLPVL